ncbi:MAG: hypothetical protein HY677_07495 [Chloroflexi bacterium]|nr:hypothetical protein [Chloroflexota bacterium]
MMEKLRSLLFGILAPSEVADSLERYYIRVLRHDGVAPTHDQACEDFERSQGELVGWRFLEGHGVHGRDAVRPYKVRSRK